MFQTSGADPVILKVRTLAENAGFPTLTPLQSRLLPQIAAGITPLTDTSGEKGKKLTLLLSALIKLEQKPKSQALIITADGIDAGKLGSLTDRLLHRQNQPFSFTVLDSRHSPRREAERLRRKPDIIIGTSRHIIDHLRRRDLGLGKISLAGIYASAPGHPEEFHQDLQFIFSKLPPQVQTLGLLPDPAELGPLEGILKKSQNLPVSQNVKEETKPMSKDPDRHSVNEEAIKDALDTMLDEIRSVQDPHELDIYKKLIKKKIPLTLRSYVGAFLLKKRMEGSNQGSNHRSVAPRNNREEGNGHIDQDGFTTLFFSIGKNRRVYPKDLSRLLFTAAKLSHEDVGAIRIMDSYSFIEIKNSHTDDVIEVLNNSEFRGRRLTVNYARKK